MKKLVQGVGLNDGKYPAYIEGNVKKEYAIWSSMLKRCYSNKVQSRQPTYIGYYVSTLFKSYSYFFEWCQTQVGFGLVGYEMDKDLLSKGNKEYNPDNCIFIPKEINLVLTKSNAARGILPIGVRSCGLKYQAQCSYNKIRKCIGTYDTPELAFAAYKTFKEAHIKELAEKYKGTIDPRAYQALLNYEVHIDD